MERGRTGSLISWTFALFVVVAVWQINLPAIFDSMAIDLGAKKDSVLYYLFINGSIPVVLAVTAGISIWFFHKVVWPRLPSSDFKGGWWVYALIAETTEGPLPVVGYFKVQHSPTEILIVEGRSFYFEQQGLFHRGDWNALTAWHAKDKFRFVFTMKSVSNPREPIPAQYDGFIDVNKTSDTPILGKEVWWGYFHDLGDRRQILGPLCAEFLLKKDSRNSGQLGTLLQNEGSKLVKRVESPIGFIKESNET